MYQVNLMRKMCQVVIRQCEGYTQHKPKVVDYYEPFCDFLHQILKVVLVHFGHGHFGLGRFGLDISATDVSATENAKGGRFGQNHKFWAWDVCIRKCVMHFIIF